MKNKTIFVSDDKKLLGTGLADSIIYIKSPHDNIIPTEDFRIYLADELQTFPLALARKYEVVYISTAAFLQIKNDQFQEKKRKIYFYFRLISYMGTRCKANGYTLSIPEFLAFLNKTNQRKDMPFIRDEVSYFLNKLEYMFTIQGDTVYFQKFEKKVIL